MKKIPISVQILIGLLGYLVVVPINWFILFVYPDFAQTGAYLETSLKYDLLGAMLISLGSFIFPAFLIVRNYKLQKTSSEASST